MIFNTSAGHSPVNSRSWTRPPDAPSNQHFSTAVINPFAHELHLLLLQREGLPSLPLTPLQIPNIRHKLEILPLYFPGGKPKVLQSRQIAMWACIKKQPRTKVYCAEVMLILAFRVERGCCFRNSQAHKKSKQSIWKIQSSHSELAHSQLFTPPHPSGALKWSHAWAYACKALFLLFLTLCITLELALYTPGKMPPWPTDWLLSKAPTWDNMAQEGIQSHTPYPEEWGLEYTGQQKNPALESGITEQRHLSSSAWKQQGQAWARAKKRPPRAELVPAEPPAASRWGKAHPPRLSSRQGWLHAVMLPTLEPKCLSRCESTTWARPYEWSGTQRGSPALAWP